MTSEYDLGCANCGGSLARREVPPDALEFPVSESVEVAECSNCGGRYVPEATLERVGENGFGRQT